MRTRAALGLLVVFSDVSLILLLHYEARTESCCDGLWLLNSRLTLKPHQGMKHVNQHGCHGMWGLLHTP